jgi:hypothetical protein
MECIRFSSKDYSTSEKYTRLGFQGLNPVPTFLSQCYKMLILNFNRPPCSHFSLFAKVVSLKVVILWKSMRIIYQMGYETRIGNANTGLYRNIEQNICSPIAKIRGSEEQYQ